MNIRMIEFARRKSDYLELKKHHILPRLPLEGSIDLTYRCNNNCRHCWLRIPADAKEEKSEISFTEIKNIVSEARNMGCRKWSISGGEPMLRQDFCEVFDYLTRDFSSYSLNTNGTLITPQIAKLMKRKGSKMIALYGATAGVHDHITRNPGSFEATMRGFAYLKETDVGFIVQLIPMRDNYHQFKDMIRLAESLSKHYRVGSTWLYLSAYADKERNAEIIRQRLSAEEVVELDKSDLSSEESTNGLFSSCAETSNKNYLFSACVNSRRDFHIDPYGKMTFCYFIKDPSLRYDLRNGSFQDCWDNFIPSLTTKVEFMEEYKKNCGSCNLRKDCRICPVYAYLECRDFNKRIEYLCRIAEENHKFKENWRKNHRRYFKIADITVRVESDLPINEKTFHPKFKQFEVEGPGEDTISIRHHFSLPDLDGKDLGEEHYRKAPWAIYKKGDSWVYLWISPMQEDKTIHNVAIFNLAHSSASIYNKNEKVFRKGALTSLTLLPTDQILLARILADKDGCYMHSCGVNFEGKGLLFAGNSGAGKSTMARMFEGEAEILCDDRVIIRKKPDGFKIYGTWSHGDVAEVSANSVPLKAVLFLEKSTENRAVLTNNKKEIVSKLLSCLIMPFVTVDWWEKTLLLLEKISGEVPCYILKFDKSGRVVELLRELQ